MRKDIISRELIAQTLTIYEPSGRIVRYDEFLQLIDFWHGWLKQRRISRSDRIVICAPNSANMQALFFACLETGIQFIGAEQRRFYNVPRYQRDDISCAITSSEWVKELTDHVRYTIHVMPDEISLQSIPINTKTPSTLDTSEPAVVAITSGTTGKPKAILHSHATLLPSITKAMEWYDADDNVLFYMNLNHLGVLTIFTLPVLLKGCHIILCEDNTPPVLREGLTTRSRGGITKLLMFDWTWNKLLKHYVSDGPYLGLKKPVVITGGKPISKEFAQSLLDEGASAVRIAYGMTECPPPVIVKNITTTADYQRTYLGELLDGWEMRLISSTGRLVLKGDGIGMDEHGQSLRNLNNGWFTTPDYCWMEGDDLHIRSRQIAKKNGQTLFLDDLSPSWLIDNNKITGGMMMINVMAIPDINGDDKLVLFATDDQKIDEMPLTLELLNARIHDFLIPEYEIDHLFVLSDVPDNGLKTDAPKLRLLAIDAIAAENKPDYRLPFKDQL